MNYHSGNRTFGNNLLPLVFIYSLIDEFLGTSCNPRITQSVFFGTQN